MQYDQCLTKGPDGSKIMITHCNLNEFKEWQYFKVFCVSVLKYMQFHFNNTYCVEFRRINLKPCIHTDLHVRLTHSFVFLSTSDSLFHTEASLLSSGVVLSWKEATWSPCRPTANLSTQENQCSLRQSSPLF